LKISRRRNATVAVAIALTLGTISGPSRADEGGVSFWLPGQMASFAASQGEPGWSVPVVYYHTSADANASRNFTAGGNLVAGLDATADLVFFAPTYTAKEPVLGAQAAVNLVWPAGEMKVRADAVITGPQGNPINLSRTDTVSGGGDLYAMGTLKWARDKDSWLAYATAGIPVGAYQVGRLANIGINHWSFDAGGGYTYLNTENGRELSVVGGLTYNFENEDTNYQNGIDGHIDVAASQFLSEQLHVGLVGYVYQQLSGDSGSGALLGDFKSSVYGIGPQAGYFFPFGSGKGYVNLRGYFELDASHRIEGWNTSLTLLLPF
jgi:hypothetical protein